MPEDEHTLKQLWQAAVDSGKPAAVVDQDGPVVPLTVDEIIVTPKGRAVVADIRAKEAGDLLSWLHAQGHLKFSSLSAQVLLDIQAGKHRR